MVCQRVEYNSWYCTSPFRAWFLPRTANGNKSENNNRGGPVAANMLCFGFEKAGLSALKDPTEKTWAVDELSLRRKSIPSDASMRRSIQDLAFSMDPNIKIEAVYLRSKA